MSRDSELRMAIQQCPTKISQGIHVAARHGQLKHLRLSFCSWRKVNTVDSLLTDTSVKRTPRVGPCLFYPLCFTLYKTENTLRRTLCAVPKGVHLRWGWLCSVCPVLFFRFVLLKRRPGRKHVLPENGLCQASAVVSADERKNRASSEITNERETAGREKGAACKHPFKYYNPPSSWKTVSRVKMSNVKPSKGAV